MKVQATCQFFFFSFLLTSMTRNEAATTEGSIAVNAEYHQSALNSL